MSLTQPISQETNLVGRIVNTGVTSSSLTIYAQFEDKKTGVARTPQADTKLFTLSKDTERFEMILADSHTTIDGITTITVNANGRSLNKYGNLVGTTTGNKHSIGSEIGCAEVHIPVEVLNEIVRGNEATGSAGFTIGTSSEGTVTIYRSTGSTTKQGILRWNLTGGKVEYSNDGSSWNSIDSISASNLVVVSGADTTPGGLNDKITVSGSGITKSITSPGGDEKLNLAVTANEYVDVSYTAGQAFNNDGYFVSKAPSADDTVEYTVASTLAGGGGDLGDWATTGVDLVRACHAGEGKIAVFYRDTTNSLGKVVIGTCNNYSLGIVTWGTPVSLGHDVGSTSICYMGEDKIAIAYRDVSSDKASVKVATISGTVPSLSASAWEVSSTMNASAQGYTAIACIDTDKIVVARRSTSDTFGYVKIGTVAGTVITPGDTAVKFLTTGAANAVSNIAITKAATDKFVVFCRNEGDSNKGKAALGVVSGTTITMATEIEIDSNASSEFSACWDGGLGGIVVWIGGASGYVMSRGYQVSGVTLSFPQAAQAVNAAAATTPSVIWSSWDSLEGYSSNFVFYEETGSSDGKINKILTPSSYTAASSIGTQYSILNTTNNVAQTAIAKFTNRNKFALVYKNEADSNKGKGECWQEYDNTASCIGLDVSGAAIGAAITVRERGLLYRDWETED